MLLATWFHFVHRSQYLMLLIVIIFLNCVSDFALAMERSLTEENMLSRKDLPVGMNNLVSKSGSERKIL